MSAPFLPPKNNHWLYSRVFFFLFLVFQDSVSLCSPGWSGTHYVVQAELKRASCLCLPSAKFKVMHHHWAIFKIFITFNFFLWEGSAFTPQWDCGQRTIYTGQFSPSPMQGLGVQLRLADLLTSALAHWAIPLTQQGFRCLFVCLFVGEG